MLTYPEAISFLKEKFSTLKQGTDTRHYIGEYLTSGDRDEAAAIYENTQLGINGSFYHTAHALKIHGIPVNIVRKNGETFFKQVEPGMEYGVAKLSTGEV